MGVQSGQLRAPEVGARSPTGGTTSGELVLGEPQCFSVAQSVPAPTGTILNRGLIENVPSPSEVYGRSGETVGSKIRNILNRGVIENEPSVDAKISPPSFVLPRKYFAL